MNWLINWELKSTDIEIGFSSQDVHKLLRELVKLSQLYCEKNKDGLIILKSGNYYFMLSFARL